MLCGIIGSKYELKCSRPHPFGQRDQIDVEPARPCPICSHSAGATAALTTHLVWKQGPCCAANISAPLL